MTARSVAGDIFVLPDKREAKRWLDLAIPKLQACSAQGDPNCQTELATLYRVGIGVEHDIREAVRLFHLAAEGNDPRAQYMLGFFYAPRPPVFYQVAASHHPPLDVLAPNGIESYVWYALAARQNDRHAIAELPRVEKKLTPEELAEALRRLEAWRPRDRGGLGDLSAQTRGSTCSTIRARQG